MAKECVLSAGKLPLGGLHVRISDRPDMTSAVDSGGKASTQPTHIRKVPLVIRITCPCDLYPLTPHFYIEKLGFTVVYIFFLFLL